MTDEQIKQNAEEYASKLVERDYHEDIWLDLYDAHIAGAHSRDEEIKELEKLLAEMTRLKNSFAGGVDILDRDNKELQEELESLRKSFYERGDKLKELMLENNKLRNPWISVEERLPDEDPYNKGYSVEVIGLFPGGYICECFCSIEENIWFNGVITCGNPTHWMPMPKI